MASNVKKKSFHVMTSSWLILCPSVWYLYFAWDRHFETLHRHHNEHNGVSNHQPINCLLNHLFRFRSKKTSKLCTTGLCAGNSPVTSEFPTQRASKSENISIWLHHHVWDSFYCLQWKWGNPQTSIKSSASTVSNKCFKSQIASNLNFITSSLKT